VTLNIDLIYPPDSESFSAGTTSVDLWASGSVSESALDGYGLSSNVAQRRVVAVKEISDTFLNWETFSVKCECVRIDI